MVALMAVSRQKMATRINSIKYASATDVALKLDQLRRLRSELSDGGSVLVVEFLSAVIALLSDPSSPVRRLAIQIICEIGLKHSKLLPEIIPSLTDVLEDDTPAVSRQAIMSGIEIFRCSLIKVAIQGLHSSEMNESLKLSWEYALLLKDEIYSIAFEDGSEGKRLPALKFVESVVLLYTPDPNGSSKPPSEQILEGTCEDFNISWLRGGHHVPNVADLSAEASRSLGLLLDKLRFPSLRYNSYLMIIVLIKSLSVIARKRPAFYGRILPVLLGFDPSISANKTLHLAGVQHALKNAFRSCLDCTHHGAAPSALSHMIVVLAFSTGLCCHTWNSLFIYSNTQFQPLLQWQKRLVSALNGIKGRTVIEQPAKEIIMADGKSHTDDTDADKKPSAALLSEHSNAGRKRTGILEEFSEDDKAGKRVRSTINNSDETGNGMIGEQETVPSSRTTSRSDEDSGPVHQLVAMFGALVAQGEKAVASLEILISSISADLLAEVVMANMRYLPPKSFKSEGSETSLMTMGPDTDMVQGDTHIRHLSLLLSDILSQSTSSKKESGIEDHHRSVSTKLEQTREEEQPRVTSADSSAKYGGLNFSSEQATVSLSESISLEDVPLMESGYTSIKAEPYDTEVVPNEIPGLSLSIQDEDLPSFPVQDNLPTLLIQDADMPTFPVQDEDSPTLPIQDEDSPTLPIQDEDLPEFSTSEGLADIHDVNSTDLDEGAQENMINLGGTPLDFTPLLSAERPEELSLKGVAMDTTNINSSTTASVGIVSRLVLPKISAPVIYLTDEQKNQLQQLAFVHIIDAYKQVNIAGGSQIRVSILAHSGMEFPSELDPWKLLKEHILSDYISNEGHELTLRVLYRLYGEAEGDRDFFSSSTATSVYETFLLQVAEILRDSFPASDKSLSRLLAEVPYLPKMIFEMLESLSSPGNNGNDDKELHGGDRVTQGLSTVWSLISLRPPYRDACLKIALKSAVHYLEEVRMKAIRLVANKLYPLSSMIEKIEDFAKEMVLSVVGNDQIGFPGEADGSHTDRQKEEHPSIEDQAGSLVHKEIYPDSLQYSASESIPPSAIAEVQRCMSLYFALCTKKHSLLRKVFDIYKDTSTVAKQVIHRQIPLLVRTIGSSPDLLDLISDPSTGSEVLLTQVIQTLTDGAVPSPELVSTIKKLYDSNLKEVDFLIPILPFLPKDEVLALFRHLVSLPLDKFQVALSHIVQGSNQSAPVLTPAEALIAIHVIDPGKDRIPLKKVTDACNACFEQRHIFTQQVLAKVLNQLVEQIPLPLLFMRTVLQAIGAFPSLVEFIMEILSRLVSKQIWNNPKLWVGFLKCALLTKPHSFGVLLQLPTAQLENALNKIPAIKDPLVAHASELHIRSSLPRSTLAVLGLVSEPQISTQIPPTETQTQETGNSEKEAATDNSKESSTGS